MTELSTANSFVVRVYRIDTEDPCRITGLVEAMDGSGLRKAFSNLEGLSTILNSSVAKPKKKRRTRNRNETSSK